MSIAWLSMLLASALPSTLLWYWLGALLIYRLKLTKATKIIGFIVAWVLTAIIALLIADQLSALSAAKEMFHAGFWSAFITIVTIALLGQYNNDNTIYHKTNEPGWNKISSFSNLLFLFLFLYIFYFGTIANQRLDSFPALIGASLGFCIIPFLAGLYYNLSKSESNIPKYIYLSTTVIMFWMILASTAQDFEEKGMMVDRIMYRNASIGVFVLSICYILYLWITKDKESNSNSQYKTENKSQPISTYQEDKYFSIALKEIESNNMTSGLWGKALAYSDGNPDKAKSYYLKERASQLMGLHQDKLSSIEDERIEALRQLDKASKDLAKQHLSDKINIIKSSVFIFFEIFFFQMIVGIVYMFGSAGLVPHFPGIVNLSFSDIISTFINSMIYPGLLAFLFWFPFHFLPVQAIKDLPLWPPKIIAILSLVLVILDYTRAAPLLYGTEGCGAYPCVLQEKAR